MTREGERDRLVRGRPLTIAGEGHAPVSGIMVEADAAAALLVLGHGAGAPMTHPFMEALAVALAAEGISTLRYNFAYMEKGRRRPDHLRRLLAVAASALSAGRDHAAGLPLLAGGKSMGGRMTSTLVADRVPPTPPDGSDSSGDPPFGLAGLVFFGFPLHAPGKPATERGDHLSRVPLPMLFHQGTRDRLADLALLQPLLARLGPSVSLHIVQGGDHSLGVLKRMGRTLDEVLAEVAGVTRQWVDRVVVATDAAR